MNFQLYRSSISSNYIKRFSSATTIEFHICQSAPAPRRASSWAPSRSIWSLWWWGPLFVFQHISTLFQQLILAILAMNQSSTSSFVPFSSHHACALSLSFLWTMTSLQLSGRIPGICLNHLEAVLSFFHSSAVVAKKVAETAQCLFQRTQMRVLETGRRPTESPVLNGQPADLEEVTCSHTASICSSFIWQHPRNAPLYPGWTLRWCACLLATVARSGQLHQSLAELYT